MAESNTTDSVRDKINLAINAQEKREGRASNRLPVILLSIFGVIILGLVVAIVLVVLKPWESAEIKEIIANKDNQSLDAAQQRIERRAQAMQDCGSIKNEYSSGEIDYEKAKSEFDAKMLSSDPVYNLYFAICYAGYIKSDIGETDGAIEVLKTVDSQLENLNRQNVIDYYVAMRSLYKYAGNSEMEEYYNSMVEEMFSDTEEVVENTEDTKDE